MPKTKTITGKDLKHQLVILGYTQESLAEELGVTWRTVARWTTMDKIPRRAQQQIANLKPAGSKDAKILHPLVRDLMTMDDHQFIRTLTREDAE